MELMAGRLETPRVSSLYPMASAGMEATGKHVPGLPAEAEGGNSGKLSSESPEGLETRQEDPGMPKIVSITSIAGK